jgi:hypothetical protein
MPFDGTHEKRGGDGLTIFRCVAPDLVEVSRRESGQVCTGLYSFGFLNMLLAPFTTQ